MDEALRAKLDEARKRMNIQQAGINADRKDDDPAMRELLCRILGNKDWTVAEAENGLAALESIRCSQD